MTELELKAIKDHVRAVVRQELNEAVKLIFAGMMNENKKLIEKLNGGGVLSESKTTKKEYVPKGPSSADKLRAKQQLVEGLGGLNGSMKNIMAEVAEGMISDSGAMLSESEIDQEYEENSVASSMMDNFIGNYVNKR